MIRTKEEVIDDRRCNPDDMAHQGPLHLMALRRRLRAGNVMLIVVLCWHPGLRLHAHRRLRSPVTSGRGKVSCAAEEVSFASACPTCL